LWSNLYLVGTGPLASYPQRYQIAPPLSQFADPSRSFMLYEYYWHEIQKGNWGAVYNELMDPNLTQTPGTTWHTSPGFMNAVCVDGHAEFFNISKTYASTNAWSGHFQCRGKYWSVYQK
jgi:hypothetical protein